MVPVINEVAAEKYRDNVRNVTETTYNAKQVGIEVAKLKCPFFSRNPRYTWGMRETENITLVIIMTRSCQIIVCKKKDVLHIVFC